VTQSTSRLLQARISRRRAIAAAGAGAVGAALLAACASPVAKRENATQAGLVSKPVDDTNRLTRGGIFRSILTSPVTFDPQIVSPHAGSAGAQMVFSWHAYSQLFRVKDGYMERSGGEIEGELVESWEVSPDKLTITAKLRRGVQYAPVAPVNARYVDAQDVVYSWERYKGFSARRDELSNAMNPRSPIVSITATDPLTLIIKLKEPNASLLANLAHYLPGTMYIVPRESIDASKLDLKDKSVGTGAFYLTEFERGVSSKWRKNPTFKHIDKRDLPYLDGIEYVDIPDYPAQLAQFRSGNVLDWYSGVAEDDILPIVRDNPQMEILDYDLQHSATRQVFGLADNSYFRDERVRQAFQMSWDRDLFSDVAFGVKRFGDMGLPKTTAWDSALHASAYKGWWLDPQSKDFGPNAKFFTYDRKEAKKLLDAAGMPSTMDFDLYYATGQQPVFYKHKDIILAMVLSDGSPFKPVAKELDFSKEWLTFRQNKGLFKGMAFEIDVNDFDLGADLFAHYNSAGSRFFGGDAALDEMTNNLQREYDAAKRRQLAFDLQRYDARKAYRPAATSASTFRIGWPAHRMRRVWNGNVNRYLATVALDQDKAPFV
jgi:peptide/nickel transport system substrate-binding protein